MTDSGNYTLFEQIQNLYDQQLYENLCPLASLILSSVEKSTDILTQNQIYYLLVYYADSLHKLNQFKRSEIIYRRALQIKKMSMKLKNVSKVESYKIYPDAEIKYQIHLCNVGMKQHNAAISILESVSSKQRNPKINMALALLYHKIGMERLAITSYKEVLKECPFALEALRNLLQLSSKYPEIDTNISINFVALKPLDCIGLWIQAEEAFYIGHYSTALNKIHLLENTPIRDNTEVLVTLGSTYFYMGDYANACHLHHLDSLNLKGMDLLANLLSSEKKISELEQLATDVINVLEHNPESYLVIAYLCQATCKIVKAIHFTHKAIMLNPRSVQGLILKGKLLLELKKQEEAIIHFREALQVMPYCFEAHKGLIDSYLAMGRIRDAITASSNACKQDHSMQNSRALTLHASTLMKENSYKAKARFLLREAIQRDPLYLPAVYLLVELYQDQEENSAIELLQRTLSLKSTGRLHQMLADLLYRAGDKERAFEHYNYALNLDPNNSQALHGMQRLEQILDIVDSSYDVDDPVESENEASVEAEEADTDSIWNDTDLSLTTS